jgi:hypothetical protein
VQRVLNYLTTFMLLLCFGAPLPIWLNMVPNYVALPERDMLPWLASVIVFVVAVTIFLIGLRLNATSPPAGFRPPGRVKAIVASVIVVGLLAVMVPVTVRGALPAYATYLWDAPQTVTLTVEDPHLSSSGRRSCEGGVKVEGQMFFSRICGVPEDLRAEMKPGDRIEVTGAGHATGLRVETVRLLP